MAYFDVYSVDLAVNVEVQIFDKKGFNELKDYDLILNSTDYVIRDFKRGQDEFGYLTDDIGRSDSFDYEWVKLNDKVELSVFYVNDDKDNPIMTYTLIPTFVKY